MTYNPQDLCIKNFIMTRNSSEDKEIEFLRSDQDARYFTEQLVK